MTNPVQPTGKIHEVGIADVFFSTTDQRGIIEHANELFVEFSRYDRGTLLGSPHSMVRHPGMPGAVFHAMWAELQAGRPFAGHVTNLAADGSAYSVYATVTPLSNGGYLSVRTRPMDEAQTAFANGLYRELAAFEAELREAGVAKREAAAQSAARLEGFLTEAGYSSVAALQQHTLPREIAKFERRSEPLPQRPEATGDLADQLNTVSAVDRALSSWSLHQQHLATLSASLRRVSTQLQYELDSTSQNIELITTMAATTAEPAALFEPLTIWAQMQGLIQSYIVELIAVLEKLDENSAENRFRVALAKLHTRMMASFSAELIDSGQRDETQTAAISLLAESLRLGLTEMGEHSIAHRALTAKTVAAITKSVSVLAIPRELLLSWQQQVAALQLSPEMRQLAEDVTASIGKLGDTLAELRRVVELCSEIGNGDDPAEILDLIAGIEPAMRIEQA